MIYSQGGNKGNGLENTTKQVKTFLDKLRRGNPKVAINYSGKIERKWKKQEAKSQVKSCNIEMLKSVITPQDVKQQKKNKKKQKGWRQVSVASFNDLDGT